VCWVSSLKTGLDARLGCHSTLIKRLSVGFDLLGRESVGCSQIRPDIKKESSWLSRGIKNQSDWHAVLLRVFTVNTRFYLVCRYRVSWPFQVSCVLSCLMSRLLSCLLCQSSNTAKIRRFKVGFRPRSFTTRPVVYNLLHSDVRRSVWYHHRSLLLWGAEAIHPLSVGDPLILFWKERRITRVWRKRQKLNFKQIQKFRNYLIK